MLWRLVYLSTAVERFDRKTLGSMVEAAVIKNARLDITGVLLFASDRFLQVLEGPREAVLSLFETIEHDERHTFVEVIQSGPVPSRLFSDWSMGLCNLEDPVSISVAEFMAVRSFLANCPDLDRKTVTRGLIARFCELAGDAEQAHRL